MPIVFTVALLITAKKTQLSINKRVGMQIVGYIEILLKTKKELPTYRGNNRDKSQKHQGHTYNVRLHLYEV